MRFSTEELFSFFSGVLLLLLLVTLEKIID